MGRTATPAPAKPKPKWSVEESRPKESYRETVEAIVVALILALVVRGFEAQAFVIPTGSMAPTLMGRHKEVTCPQCGFVYSVNASEEIEGPSVHRQVYSSLCSNCRFQATKLDETPSFKGDRILVMMFPYDLPFLPGAGPPKRWEVVVFRYPEEPEISYIKRLVGLPGETVRIKHGDIYIRQPGSHEFRLERKPLVHQAAMQIPVYDDRNQARALADREEWRRWKSATPGAWKIVESGPGVYLADGVPSDKWSEMRYQHLVPDPEQWEAILSDRPLSRTPRATLITDFCSYNTNLSANNSNLTEDLRLQSETAWLQAHWVGDLTVSANLEVTSPGGEVRLDLVKGGVSHTCTIDLATGAATLSRGGQDLGRLETSIRGPGRHGVEFANVDDRLSLSVDGRAVGGEGIEYDQGETVPMPDKADLSPAGIAVRNGTVRVSDLVLKRDIYYTQHPGDNDYGSLWANRAPRNPVELFDILSDPSQFPNLADGRSQDFVLGDDRFLMLGDNSLRSKDSRGWQTTDESWDPSGRKFWEVPRKLLTGKAFYIYWPHGVPFGPDIRISRDFRIPFRPYFERMKRIR